jgi:hypothetical protein
VAYTYDADPGAALSQKLKLRRYTYNGAKGVLTDPLDLITNLPAHNDHGGGPLVFGPDQNDVLAFALVPADARDLTVRVDGTDRVRSRPYGGDS